MKKITLVLSAMLLVLFTAPIAFSAPSEHLNWGHQLNASETACPSGKPILNVS